MKQCKFCNVYNPDDAVYCRNCRKMTFSVPNEVEKSKTVAKKAPKPVGKKILLMIIYSVVSVLYCVFLFHTIIEWNVPAWVGGLFILAPIGLLLLPWRSD